jgi:hypothetical protein
LQQAQLLPSCVEVAGAAGAAVWAVMAAANAIMLNRARTLLFIRFLKKFESGEDPLRNRHREGRKIGFRRSEERRREMDSETGRRFVHGFQVRKTHRRPREEEGSALRWCSWSGKWTCGMQLLPV